MKTYKLKINGNDYEVVINSVVGDVAEVSVNGTAYNVEIQHEEQTTERPTVNRPAPASTPSAAAPARPKPQKSGSGRHVESPLEGNILDVMVNVGDAIKAGQTVAILEAMKMENEILAEFDGTVTSVNVQKGEHVALGTPIITIG